MLNDEKRDQTIIDGQIVSRIIRRDELRKLVGCSYSTINNWLNPKSKYYVPSFPKPVRLGAGSSVGWIDAEVFDWIQSRPRAYKG